LPLEIMMNGNDARGRFMAACHTSDALLMSVCGSTN